MALRVQPSDVVPDSDLPTSGGSDIVPESDLPSAGPQKFDQLSPERAEAKRQSVEGAAPELGDAPVANAVLSGALTPGTFARLGMSAGASGLKAALTSGVDFGIQQGLQDWVANKLPAGMQNHPWLREAMGIVGGTAMTMLGKGVARNLSGRAAAGASVLNKIAQARALNEPEEQIAGSAQPIFEGKPAEQGPEGTETPPPAPEPEKPGEGEAKPEEAPPSGPQPVALQPQQEIDEAVGKGDMPRAKEALQEELARDPRAEVSEMRVGDMKVDPERFQYKTNTNRATGADPALNDVEVYQRGLSGLITVYHDRDGQFYVVNGHGRHAAVERLEGPDATHKVQVIESRPQEDPQSVKGAVNYGQTPEQARAYGAVINIAEGRGTAMDAARFFRQQGMDTAAMRKSGIALNPTEEKTQRAVSLSQLSPTMFRAVDVGIVPEKHGVVIGRELGDRPELQDAIYRDYKNLGGRELSAQKLADKINFQKSAGTTISEQTTLFGKEEMKKSLADEFADVIGGVRNRLKGEKRLFGISEDAARKLEEAGVAQVDVETGEKLSAAAANNLAVLKANAFSVGSPINELLRNAAKELSENPKNKAAIIKESYNQLIDAMGGIKPEAEESPQQSTFAMGGQEAEPPKESEPAPEPEPDTQMTLGVGLPVVQAAERLYKLLPEETRETPAKFGRWLQRTFAPETVSAFSQRATGVLESKAAELRARIGSAAQAVSPLREYFQGLDGKARYNLASQMEKGEFDALPDYLKPFGPAMKAITDRVHDRLQKLTPDQKIGYVENYWRHMWADSPEKVMEAFNRLRAGSGKALTAGKGFLKQRRFPTIVDGMDAGLTPKFKNPVDQWLAGTQQEWRYATGKEMWNAIKDSGIAKFARVTERAPKDMERINDSVTRVMTKTDKGVAHMGDWYVPKEVARIFNNYLDPGIGPNPLSSLSALGNRIRVELSGFHFLLTSLSHTAQQVGDQAWEGIGDIANGNIGRGALKVALSPVAVAKGPIGTYQDWRAGRDVISKALGGNFDDPAVKDALMGGEGFNYAWDNPANLIGDTWKDAFGIPGRLADKLNPIMKHWVAPLKVGAFLRQYAAKLDEAYTANGGQELAFAQRRTIANQVRKHIDNVYGQISRDNLHMSNTLKDATHMIIAYPGWQIGSLRLFGGAARGIGKGLLQSDLDPQAQMALRYVTGMIITSGTVGTMMNYLMTGKMPSTVHDAFLWPTGQKDANGNEIRTEGPEYLVRDYLSTLGHRRQFGPNDVLAWPKAIGESGISKMNWPLAAASYILRNADFFGKPIYFSDIQSQPRQVQEIVKQFMKEGGVPFSINNAMQLAKEGKEPLKSMLQGMVGMTPESRALRQTPAQNYIDQYKPPVPPVMSPDQMKREQLLGKLETDLRAEHKGGPSVDWEPIKDALRNKQITQAEVTQRMQDSGQRPFALAVKRAPLLVTLGAWKIASDNGDEADERDAANAIFAKLRTAELSKLPPDQLAVARDRLAEFMKKTIRGEGEEAR